MSREILQDIIKDFELNKFIRFFREKSRSFAPRQETLIQENFNNGHKLGEIKLTDGNLIVCAFKVNQPLSERSGKKAQYEAGKRVLKEHQVDAGIFIFYDESGNFRFSLIYANYLGKRRDWSVFRRFTYFVSSELTNKTFLQRIGGGDFSSLEKIKDAFSVEKVTKEFYEDIANWYFWAVQHSTFPKDAEVEENGRNITVIRLITRLIFIWFMRERGLVPKELFDGKTIRERLKDLSSEQSTYYKAILQNLFFATLSTKKNERKFRSEIRGYKGYNPDFGNQNVFRFQVLFKNPEKLKDYFDEIPFLNGGLFECLDDKPNGIYIDGFTAVKKNQPNVPNFLFFSSEQNVDLNTIYGTKNKNYKVRGLLDILSSYNFTIDENTPDDQDIALDPELLGRVFENLLASFNPETSTTARKATGSYYTPREIVDYMVSESLKAYFKTHLSVIEGLDKKIEQLFSTGSEENPFDKSESKKIVELIESVRLVDPAVGSGAFPMGALNKLVFILNKVDPGNELWKQAQLSAVDTIPDPRIKQDTKNRIEEFFKGKNADYGRKLYLIQKCIYGVDIQQIAVEIAKLRFFISLLVDEKIDKTKENWGIEPLPNLDFKIMQGDSLISEFLGIDFDNGQEKQGVQGQVGLGLENEDDSLIKEFERIKIDYQNEPDKDRKAKLKKEVEYLMIKIFETNLRKKYSELKPIEERAQGIPNLKTREGYTRAEKQKFSKKHGLNLENIENQLREFARKNKTRPFFPWKLYFAEVFSEKGGFDVVIANPPYNAKLSQEERQLFKSEYESVKAGRQDTAAIFVEKAKDIGNNSMQFAYILPYRLFSRKRNHGQFQVYTLMNFSIKNIIYLGTDVGFSTNDEFMILIMTSIYNRENIVKVAHKPALDSLNERDIFQEMPQSIFIQKNEINLNLVKFNPALINKIENNTFLLNSICEVKDGIVPYIREKLISNKRVDERYVKFAGIASKYNLQKYKFSYEPLYLCYDINEAKIYIKNKEELRKVQLRERAIFLNRKIVSAQNSSILKAAIDEDKVFVSNSIHSTFIKKEYLQDYYLEYILALMNSSLINYYHNFLRLKATDLHPQILVGNLKKLPVKKISKEVQKPFIEIVDKILAITKSGDYLENPAKKEEVKEYERQIDQMVYKLYGLTPEEIAVVEGKNES